MLRNPAAACAVPCPAVNGIREATWADFDEVVALAGPEAEPEHVRQRWNLPGYDLGWVAVDDGRIVGHAGLDATHDASVLSQSPTLGAALLARVTERARERGFPYIAITAASDDEPPTTLVRSNDFSVDREILRMWRSLDGELPEPVWPGGVRVRTYDGHDGERVQTFLDVAYAAWDPDHVPRSHQAWLAAMTDHDDFDPTLWFLAERGGTLVGCALHWKESKHRGWVKDLAVLDGERGRGLGTALLHHAFRAYGVRGVTSVGLKVDSTNPTGAPRLYERLGFVVDQRLVIWIKRL